MSRHIVMGVVAHVDAGKTTLSEQILLCADAISEAGRVDNGDTHFDTDTQERARGITIFSSQASFAYNNTEFVLIDTPGHTDFAAETERAFSVLDVCVLVVSAAEGVQSHTRTLWKLLRKFNIPTFIFFNKIDISHRESEELLSELGETFGDGFVDFSKNDGTGFCNIDNRNEEIAMLDESLMEDYLEKGSIDDPVVLDMIAKQKLFPVFYGTALKGIGADTLLDGLCKFTPQKEYPAEFGARVYKITSDDKGNRLTFMKITGGSIAIRQQISGVSHEVISNQDGEEQLVESPWSEKVTGIRKYNGAKYENITEASAGDVVAVAGLTHTTSGMALGIEKDDITPTLVPVISYRMKFEGAIKPAEAYSKIKALEDEMPEISLNWDEQLRQISVRLMGAIQTQILTNIIHDRFGYVISFDAGRIAYRETICDTVEGVGHFEPLRHYAEVHLLLEPGERGSGLVFDIDCPEDVLAKNWQRLIYTHLGERTHRGVLTGSPITDMKITVISGKAHAKHTEGGDFRQATYRAIRQGLMKAESMLLEPYYRFTLELPMDQLGRAMTDIEARFGKCEAPDMKGDIATLKGVAPVSTMHEYATDVAAYTAGEGRLSLVTAGYHPCHNTEEVLEERGYNPDEDMRNPSSSVFCTHGAGFNVPWNEVEDYMHMESAYAAGEAEEYAMPVVIPKEAKSVKYNGSLEEDAELFAIFEREFGPVKRRRFDEGKRISAEPKVATGKTTEDYKAAKTEKEKRRQANAKRYLLVDGYNVIHSWNELKELASENLAAARDSLCESLCNYAGYSGEEVIVVFDAYKVSGGTGSVLKYNNIHVIYTKEAETADAYIEKACHEIAKENHVRVVSSDGMVQLIVMGSGALRISSTEFKDMIEEESSENIRHFSDE